MENESKTILSETFSLSHDTNIQRPRLPWKFANATQAAAMEAYQTIKSNVDTLQQMGLNKPAAALFINPDRNYSYNIYDKSSVTPESALPKGTKLILPVEPYIP